MSENEKTHGSGSTSGTLYKVEVRSTYFNATIINDKFAIDDRWRILPIEAGATPWGANIPVCSWDARGLRVGLVSYIVAEAHRWAFLAYLEAVHATGRLCIETRLVAVEFHESYTTKELGVSEAMQSPRKPVTTPRAADAALAKGST